MLVTDVVTGGNEGLDVARTLFVFWHGLGDIILAEPAIRAYRRASGDYVGWAMLERLKGAGLHECNPHIDQLHWTADAWNDFPSYEVGQQKVMAQAQGIARAHGYDRTIVVDHRSSPCHKILRTAREMGVDLGGDVATDVHYDRARATAELRSMSLPRRYVFFHGKTGVRQKDLPLDKVKEWLAHLRICLPIVSPDFTWDVSSHRISVAFEAMRRACHIIVADSVMYHAAHAMGLCVDLAYFARGRDVWEMVRPLHPCFENVVFRL